MLMAYLKLSQCHENLAHDREKARGMRYAHQWFLTWLSVLPGRSFAISDQRFPNLPLASAMICSSSALHAFFLITGSAKQTISNFRKQLSHVVQRRMAVQVDEQVTGGSVATLGMCARVRTHIFLLKQVTACSDIDCC